jgi:hypothetical protein|tara:strand:- start:431 stop:820 length:390 start_codon:yes stop_codon:yes gene_type:complete
MGMNSTEVSYNFGQLGSIFNDSANPMFPPTGKVFVAVHFLEDTQLEAHGGLVAVQDSTNGYEYVSTEDASGNAQTAHDIAHDGTVTAISGAGGLVIDNSNTIPAGTIIYGRFNRVEATTTKMIIAYIGE